MTVVATVGTTHPLAFAGLIFAALAIEADGARPVCVIAGVTAQDASRVTARTPIARATIEAQFDALRRAAVAAFHVGALVSADAVGAVAAGLRRYPGVPVVVDPVLAATDGDELADGATRTAIRETLLPRATLVTPNLHEASALLERAVTDVASMREAAIAFTELGPAAALIKGGHLASAPTDVLATAGGITEFASIRIDRTVRGTGDLLAVTIATDLARGASLHVAIERARERVRTALATSTPFANTHVAQLFTTG